MALCTQKKNISSEKGFSIKEVSFQIAFEILNFAKNKNKKNNQHREKNSTFHVP